MVRQAFDFHTNNLGRILQRVRREHPNLKTTNDVIHYARAHDPEMKRYRRARADREKINGRIDSLTKKGWAMAKNMNHGEIKTVGRTSYGNVIVHKGAGDEVTVARPTDDRHLINTVTRIKGFHSWRDEKSYNWIEGEGPWKQYASRVAPKGAHGVASTGSRGG